MQTHFYAFSIVSGAVVWYVISKRFSSRSKALTGNETTRASADRSSRESEANLLTESEKKVSSNNGAPQCPYADVWRSSKYAVDEDDETIPIMTLSDVQRHGGSQSATIYVVSQGFVFDVTKDVATYGPGGSLHALAGKDITRVLAKGIINEDSVSNPSVVGLTFGEVQELETRHRGLLMRYKVIGKVPPEDRKDVVLRPKLDTTAFHKAIEDSDIKTVREALQAGASVNQCCPRSFLTPLHKAVERDNLELAQLLVESGADVQARADLYDGQTPLQLATSLGSARVEELLRKAAAQ